MRHFFAQIYHFNGTHQVRKEHIKCYGTGTHKMTRDTKWNEPNFLLKPLSY